MSHTNTRKHSVERSRSSSLNEWKEKTQLNEKKTFTKKYSLCTICGAAIILLSFSLTRSVVLFYISNIIVLWICSCGESRLYLRAFACATYTSYILLCIDTVCFYFSAADRIVLALSLVFYLPFFRVLFSFFFLVLEYPNAEPFLTICARMFTHKHDIGWRARRPRTQIYTF